MSLGEVNKGAVALILLVAIAAAGFLWWSRMYTPAVKARTAAVAAESTAQGGLSAAKAELAAAQERIEQAQSEAGKPDDSVGKVAVSRKAIPSEKLIDDAAIVLMDLAERSGVSTGFASPADEASAEGSGASGATPIDLTFEAAGTYSEMMLFMSLVEDTVIEKDGKLYTRDRLFNVRSLEIGAEGEESSTGGGEFEGAGSESATGPIVQRGDMLFTVVVRMYTSSTENSASVGEGTPDPAEAPLEGAGDPGVGSSDLATGEAGATNDPASGTPGPETSDMSGVPGTEGTPSTTGGAAPAGSGGF